MSEVQTSPAPAVSAEATPAPAVSESAPVAAVAEESASPSEVTAETQEAPVESSTSTVASATSIKEEPAFPSLADFDPSGWEGNIDLLPNELQEPIRFLHRNLEGGYTKKFQDLASQRKEFEETQSSWTQERETREASLKDVEDERNMLRQLLEGTEDPRISEFLEHNEKLKSDLSTLKSEYDQYQTSVRADIETQAKKYAEDFRGKHAEIFDSEEKRTRLGELLDLGWDPEAAVQLVDGDEKLVQLADELRQRGVPTEVAVEHARLKLGGVETKRVPRPGARITAGAEGRNNPASTPGSSLHYANTSREARSLAAREALNWAAQNRKKS